VVLLGCIADDFTGATDLASVLVRGGMRTVQFINTPAEPSLPAEADAVVIALKSRTVPAHEAVDLSLGALRWLRDAGAQRFFFKYCSTFDSTDRGNIGPVADALLAELGSPFTIACPAYPENGRTVYQGHLFVGDQLLSESPMRHHPLTPMVDANLVRVLSRQSSGRVGSIPYDVVCRGPEAVWERCRGLRDEGVRYAVVDALDDRHLRDIAAGCADLPLITGGAGLAMGLPANFRALRLLGPANGAGALPRVAGHSAVLAGSCSEATLAQVAEMKRLWPAFLVDAMALVDYADPAQEALRWAEPHLSRGPVLIYSSMPPGDVARVQAALGSKRAGDLIEHTFAAIARGVVARGVRRLIVAGGETAGAVVQALGIGGLRIGPQIEPGVPWTLSLGDPPIALALKSGNFGSRDFFSKALQMLS
jgi:uncharacterized protein YgbK (DUF1537 family)